MYPRDSTHGQALCRVAGSAQAAILEPFRLQREVIDMNAMLRVPRSRGALSGLLLVLLGAWGALIPFIGPYFHYAYTPDTAWTYTSGRLWLEILPGGATLLGGLIVLSSSYRHMGVLGAWLAVLSGAWFTLGMLLRPIWNGTGSGGPTAGTPVGGNLIRMWEQIGFFTGLGIAIVLVAAAVLGRFTVIGAREAARADVPAEETEARPVPPNSSTGRFSYRRRTAADVDSDPATERVGSGAAR
jgi:hypothetical protein